MADVNRLSDAMVAPELDKVYAIRSQLYTSLAGMIVGLLIVIAMFAVGLFSRTMISLLFVGALVAYVAIFSTFYVTTAKYISTGAGSTGSRFLNLGMQNVI